MTFNEWAKSMNLTAEEYKKCFIQLAVMRIKKILEECMEISMDPIPKYLREK